jgi:hypothetical protein
MFSLLFFAALLTVLTRVHDGQIKLLAFIPLIFAVWVNVHGGWVVGAGVLAVFAACSLFDPSLSASHRRLVIAASIGAGLATLCNPYGVRMLTFMFETVGPDRADIMEWQPVTKLPAIALTLWLVPTSVAAAAVWRRRGNLPWSSLAIVLMLAVASFRVARIVSFHALAVGFLVAPYVWSRATIAHESRVLTGGGWRSAAVMYLAIVGIAIALFGRRVAMDGGWLPEPEAAAYVTGHRLQGNMFTWFNYGEYAIWHFWPAIRVSIDGRRETVFTDELRAAHRRVYDNAPSAVDEIRRLNPDYVWLPIELPVIQRLEAAGWLPIFRGSRSTILGHPGTMMSVDSTMALPIHQPRAFPGP